MKNLTEQNSNMKIKGLKVVLWRSISNKKKCDVYIKYSEYNNSFRAATLRANQVYLQRFCSSCVRWSPSHSSYCVRSSWLHVRQWHKETWRHGIPQQTCWPEVSEEARKAHWLAPCCCWVFLWCDIYMYLKSLDIHTLSQSLQSFKPAFLMDFFISMEKFSYSGFTVRSRVTVLREA